MSEVQDTIRKALGELNSNRPESARKVLKKALEKFPNSPDLWHFHGLSCRACKELEEAAHSIEKALKFNPGYVEAWNNLSAVLLESGSFQEAYKAARKACDLNPEYDRAWNHLGLSALELGQLDEAEDSIRKSLQVNANSSQALCNLGRILLARGDLEQASRTYLKAMNTPPLLPQAVLGLGICKKKTGKVEEAEILFQQLYEQTGSVEALESLSQIHMQNEDFKQAREEIAALLRTNPEHEGYLCNYGICLMRLKENPVDTFQKTIGINPSNIDAHYNLGLFYLENRNWDNAKNAYLKVLELQPGHPGSLQNLAVVYRSLGDMKKAEDLHRIALKDTPLNTSNWYHLFSSLKTVPDEDLSLLESLPLKEEDQDEFYHFALFQAYNQRKDYQRASEHCLKGNTFRFRQMAPHQIQRDFDFIRQASSLVNSLPDIKVELTSTIIPIFILGLPRSGSTLIEQILGSHSRVSTGGELRFLGDSIKEVLVHKDSPKIWSQDLEKLRESYLNKIEFLAEPNSLYLSDKMPHNFLHLPFILKAFPEARILYTRRHPFDNALSLFQVLFREGHSYCYDLDILCEYIQKTEGLFKQFSLAYPGKFLPLHYENTVDSFENMVPKLLEFCSLEYESACLEFHKNRSAVSTASFSQVRKPIYKSSKFKWKKYEAMLKPLTEKLADEAESYLQELKLARETLTPDSN